MAPKFTNTDKILMFCACFVQSVTISGFGYGLNVLYAELVQVFQTSRSEVALIQSLFLGIVNIGGIFWSYPVKRYRTGACVMAATLIGCLGILASSFTDSVSLIIVFIGVLSSIAFGICSISPYIMANATFGKHKPVLLSLLTCASSTGQFVFTLVMDLLIEEYKWDGCLFIISAILLNNFMCGLVMHLFDPNRDKWSSDKHSSHSPTIFIKPAIFRDWKMWLLLIESFILPVTAAAESRFYVDLLVLKGYTLQTGAFLASLIGIANLIGRLLAVCTKCCGVLSSLDHAVYSSVINGISHLMVVYLQSYWGLFSAAIVNGLSVGLLVAHLPVVVLDIFGKEKYAAAFVAFNLLGGVGFFVGGVSGGVIHDLLGTYDALFQLSFAGNVLIAIIFFILTISERKCCSKQDDSAQNTGSHTTARTQIVNHPALSSLQDECKTQNDTTNYSTHM